MSLCYWLRPDACAAVTAWPVWSWVIVGLGLAGVGFTRRRVRTVAAIGLLWLIYCLVLAEEPQSLMRAATSSGLAARRNGRAVRVVSLNCAGGNPEAAAEVARYRPDVVLLQESPGKKDVEVLAKRLFGSEAGTACGIDASIIARGRVRQLDANPLTGMFLTGAQVRLPSGTNIRVYSVRLSPPVFRIDLWSPGCWRELSADRRSRREQVRLLADEVGATPSTTPVIIGGDLNAPAGDAAFRLLKPSLHDTFREAGIGWGNTVLNETPILRFDQVWACKNIRATAVAAKKTLHSDHRMVVCDLLLP